MKLLTSINSKTVKGEKLGYLTGILYLAPAKISGYEVCPKRSEGCTKACLYTAGCGIFTTVQKVRINKTKLFFEDRENFLIQLKKDIKALEKKAKKLNMLPAVRLNGTSDINWTRFGIMEEFPQIQFYDYTKVINRLHQPIPKNYHLTFSRSENNDVECKIALSLGFNIAVVFQDELPDVYMGYPVYNGDEHDVRFLDPFNCVIGLKAKGKGKKDDSGFIIKTNQYERFSSR